MSNSNVNIKPRYRNLLVGFTLFSLCAHGNEMETNVVYSAEYSDNALLLPGQGPDELTQRPAVTAAYEIDLSDVRATLNYSAQQTNYQNDLFDDRFEVLGEGQVFWSIIDKRLSFNVFQNSNRVSIDSTGLQTAGNETRRDVLQFGPTFQMNLGARAFISLSGSLAETSFNNGVQTEAQQDSLQVRYQQQLSGAGVVGISASQSNMEFQLPTNDYRNRRFSLSYSGGRESLKYSLEAGPNRIERVGSTISGTFIAASVAYQANRFSATLTSTQELTDSSSGLVLNGVQTDVSDNGDGNVGRTDVVERKRTEIRGTYIIVPRKITATLMYARDSQDYDLLPQDQSSRQANWSLKYALSERLDVGYRYNYTDQDFEGGFLESAKLKSHQIDVNYRVNTRVRVSLWTRDRSRVAVPFLSNYDEWSGGVRVSFLL